jgi:hypothetical protein
MEVVLLKTVVQRVDLPIVSPRGLGRNRTYVPFTGFLCRWRLPVTLLAFCPACTGDLVFIEMHFKTEGYF